MLRIQSGVFTCIQSVYRGTDERDFQSPKHDVFALGMVMIIIGLWKPFTSFKKYHLAKMDEERQKAAMQHRKPIPERQFGR
jgi:hypothetical protein